MATSALDPQGIMALPMEGAPPDTGAPAQPQLGLDDSYDAVQQGLQNASPEAYTAVNDELAKLAPQLDQLPDELLDQLLQIVQYMHDNPKEYAQLVQDLVDEGIIDQGDFPEEYDPEFLATLGMVILQARKTRQAAQQGAMPIQQAPVPPANMARGGIAEAAHMVASRGRGPDTMLAHITPKEAQMLRSKGGMGIINPATGLPEYGFWSELKGAVSGAAKGVTGAVKGVFKGVTGAIKGIVSSPLGKILGTVALAAFIGPGAFGLSGAAGLAAQMGLASGAMTALSGGNLKDVLKSAAIGGATAFFGAPGGAVSNFVGGAVTNAAANAAITSGIVGTGIGLLSGQKLQDAVKSGLTAGAISGLSTGISNKGFGKQIEAPKVDTAVNMANNQQAPTSPTSSNSPVTSPNELSFGMNSSSSPSQTSLGMQQGTGPTALGPAQGYQPQTVGQSLKTMGGGVMDLAQGDFSKGFEGISKGAGDLFFPSSPTADQVQNSSAFTNARAAGADYNTAYQRGADALGDPGMMRTYGPSVAAGLGIAALGGAFTPKPPEPTQLQNDINERLAAEKARVAANPGDYVPKGLERFGIKYNERGEIIGSEPFNPAPAPGSTEVASNYMPYTPSQYMTPTGAIGGGLQPLYQPYNTASMYTNLMPPQYRANGGLMRSISPTINSSIFKSLNANTAQMVKDEAAKKAQADRVAAIKNSYRPPVQPMQPQVQQPTEVTKYQQLYDANQISDLSRRLYPSIYNSDYRNSMVSNDGGIASLAKGGYPRRTGQISGPGTETSDSIPAMLSDGEFVFTAKAVRGAGKGSRLAGAKKMYALMHQLERNAARG